VADAEILSPARPALPEAALGQRRFGDRVGERIGRYTLLAQIAEGGMGSVYAALMRGPADFSRLVAIKCVHTRWLDDPRLVTRFKNEIQLSARVLHPNVVQTLDVVETDGELFLVMDYADGVTLAALLSDLNRQSEPLAPSHAVSIVTSVLRGLHAAHNARDETGRPLHIVHRDVSPQNIVIGRNGHVQLLDFGVAKVLEQSQHTAVGTMLGRIAYMAPEQLEGSSSSPCSDVFSVGVVLWECLVGKRLFQRGGGSEGELIYSLLSQSIPRARSQRADVPPALDAALARALERNPEQRFQSADEFSRALETAAAPLVPPAALAALLLRASGSRLAARDALIQRTRQQALAALAPPAQRMELMKPAEVVSVTTRAVRPVRSRNPRARWRWLAGAAVLCVAGVASVVWLRRSQTGATADEPSAANQVPAPRGPEKSYRALALEPPPIAAPAPSAEAQPRAAEPELARNAGGTPPRPRSVAARPRRRAQGASTDSAAARTESCDPPTYVGKDGIRHFKMSCL
jgi:serine/threonine-protein kinase